MRVVGLLLVVAGGGVAWFMGAKGMTFAQMRAQLATFFQLPSAGRLQTAAAAAGTGQLSTTTPANPFSTPGRPAAGTTSSGRVGSPFGFGP